MIEKRSCIRGHARERSKPIELFINEWKDTQGSIVEKFNKNRSTFKDEWKVEGESRTRCTKQTEVISEVRCRICQLERRIGRKLDRENAHAGGFGE